MEFFHHPIAAYVVQNLLTITIIAFTPPYHPLRIAVVPVTLVYIYLTLPTYLAKLHYRVLASIVSGTTFSNVLTYIDRVVLAQWSFDDGGPPPATKDLTAKQIASRDEITSATGNELTSHSDTEPPAASSPTVGSWRRLRYGYFINSAARLVGTPFQVKSVPAYRTSQPLHIPSRSEFLLRKFFIFCFCYLVLDLATSSADTAANPVTYHPAKIPLFSRWNDVTNEEVVRKTIGGVAYWVASYCTMQCYMGAWAFLSVACGDEPKYWRPNFGSLSDVYILRRFLGTSGHLLFVVLSYCPSPFFAVVQLTLKSHAL